jgi:hypothetical protein
LRFESSLVTFTMKRVFSDGSQVLRFTYLRRRSRNIPTRRRQKQVLQKALEMGKKKDWAHQQDPQQANEKR